jgi:hypothetical protein
MTKKGVYTVQVNSIALAGIVYTPIGTTSFVLTVTDPCISAVITGTTVAGATVYVGVAQSTQSTFTSFTYTSSIGSTACGVISYSATEAPPFSVFSLTTFTLVAPSFNF